MKVSHIRSQAVLALGMLLVTSFALGGCSAPQPPAETPSIIGVVTEVTAAEDGEGTLLVEAPEVSESGYDVAWVRVTTDTRVLEAAPDGAYVSVGTGDIEQGLTVRVWFTGPVAESYPVQAVAGTIVITQ